MNITKEGDDLPGIGGKILTVELYKDDFGNIRPKYVHLLEEALYFINNVPNRRYKVRGYKDSYELASQIGKYLKQVKE